MIADDEIDATLLGIGDFFDGFDAAVQDDDEAHTGFIGVVDAAFRHPVPLFVTIGDIVVDVAVIATDEPIDQCHGGDAVNVIVAVDHDALLAGDGEVEAFDRHLHIVHEERVVQVGELRAEESACRGGCVDAAFAEHAPEDGVHAQFFGQSSAFGFFAGRGGDVVPLVGHNCEGLGAFGDRGCGLVWPRRQLWVRRGGGSGLCSHACSSRWSKCGEDVRRTICRTKQIDMLRYAYFLETAVSSVLILAKKERKSVVCRFSRALSCKTRGLSLESCAIFRRSCGVLKMKCPTVFEMPTAGYEKTGFVFAIEDKSRV